MSHFTVSQSISLHNFLLRLFSTISFPLSSNVPIACKTINLDSRCSFPCHCKTISILNLFLVKPLNEAHKAVLIWHVTVSRSGRWVGDETRANEAPRDPQGARLSPPPNPRRIHLRPLGRRQDHVSEVYSEVQKRLLKWPGCGIHATFYT